MERISLLTLLRNWLERQILRRSIQPLLSPRARLEREDGSVPEFPPALARTLRERLNTVTPWYVKIDIFTTRRGGVAYTIRTPWLSSRQGEERGGTLDTYLWNILSSVQSFMVHRSKKAWPASASLELSSPILHPGEADARQRAEAYARQVPQPGIAIEGDRVRLWYGDAASPVLEFEPVTLQPG